MMLNMKKMYFVLFLALSACLGPRIPQDLIKLQGQTVNQVLSEIGKPTISRQEGAHQIWSYYQNDCSVLIFFDENETVQHIERRGNCRF